MKKIILSVVIALSLIFGISFVAKTYYGERPSSHQQIEDTRALQIDNYFKAHKMPLDGYGKQMVEVADKYNLDWRLLPAISVRESSGGLHMCKNNPFGWGSCKITFNSLNEAIETVGYKLANLQVYKDKTTWKKLYYYNGTVIASYPDEVVAIMNKIGTI